MKYRIYFATICNKYCIFELKLDISIISFNRKPVKIY